jgi:GT2 family glycosyltransferase
MADTSHPLLFAQTLRHPADAVRLVVVVPTYQRPDALMRTLQSLAEQDYDQSFAVIVVENHAAEAAGAKAATAFFAQSSLEGTVLIQARQGNCFAYNAGFLFAGTNYPAARYIAVIDDDEMADPNWLTALATTAAQYGADCVGGPQVPQFEDEAGRAAFAAHPVFKPTHHKTGAVPLIHSTGNCLIGTHVIKAMGHPVLDEAFNFTGGGDTDFFTRCKAAGFSFAWSQHAIVREIVPARRTERSWITSRALRNGMLSTLIQKKAQPGFSGRINVILRSLALLAAAPFRAIPLTIQTGSAYAGSYHLMIALGRIMAEFGYAQEQYRQPEKN